MRPRKKKSKKKKSKVVVQNEFTWMLGITNKVDTHLKTIENRLKTDTIQNVLNSINMSIDSKYRRLQYTTPSTSLLDSIKTSKEKYNLVVDIYNNEWDKKPWYQKLLKKKEKLKKFDL